ncbi:MAG: hypothetical protein AAF298_03350 [Cyanobacteria bacterium P01_A01_bin.40]
MDNPCDKRLQAVLTGMAIAERSPQKLVEDKDFKYSAEVKLIN